jgi:hypothetical protein
MAFVSSLPATATAPNAPGILERFHPAVRLWFERRFPDGPTEAQAGGWPAIVGGQHTLVCAPTGSGKTLAGFLAAIDALYRAHDADQAIEGVTRVVYLSPLKTFTPTSNSRSPRSPRWPGSSATSRHRSRSRCGRAIPPHRSGRR